MSDRPSEDVSGDDTFDDESSRLLTDGGENAKVVGEVGTDGKWDVGVLGHNKSDNGGAIGVKGKVDGDGYGLYTSDDAKVEGTVETPTVQSPGSLTITTGGPERALELGVSEEVEVEDVDGDEEDTLQVGGNVIFGYPGNEVRDDAIGAVISGGGQESSEDIEFFEERENIVYADYGTISGGVANRAGEEVDEEEVSPSFSTVGGGQKNEAFGHMSTISGGSFNVAASPQSTIGGGSFNEALGERNSTVGGGMFNVADGQSATVAGGGATIEEGVLSGEGNAAYGECSTVGGGGANVAGVEDDAEVTHATVGGGSHNRALGEYATVSGGGPNDPEEPSDSNNVAYNEYCTISGGGGNQAGTPPSPLEGDADAATVSGGKRNQATASYSTVGGGAVNRAHSGSSTVAGGTLNTANAFAAVIGGGANNTASGERATVPGGGDNEATGDYSFATGREAKATEDGTFVVGDSTEDVVESEEDDEVHFQHERFFIGEGDLELGDGVLLKYTGGGQVVVENSSARYKTNIEPLSTESEAILDLEPRTFEFEERGEPSVGLIAEEVAEHVPELVITDETGRPEAVQYDKLGVYLIAEVRRQRGHIEEVTQELEERDERIEELEDRLSKLEARLDAAETPADD